MKRIKMCIYGEPGTGKSVFACKAPKPFFICTDGNYEWLEDFGAKEEDHIQVNSWDEAKKAFNNKFEDYETVVVDLTEDLFKWCEQSFCIKNKLDHVGDIGFGKGYDITRNEFFIEMCKLINLDKNVIFIMHGATIVVKDRRGVEHTKFMPSSRLPEKVVDMLEGRVRYFLRCYLKGEENEDGKVVKKRYLSLIPKENEFGICRGIDENSVPHDIPLDFEIFAKCIGLGKEVEEAKEKVRKPRVKTIEKEETIKEELVPNKEQNQEEVNEEVTVSTEEKKPIVEENKKEEIVEEPKQEEAVEEKPKTTLSNAEKLAAIKAKLAAMKNNK